MFHNINTHAPQPAPYASPGPGEIREPNVVFQNERHLRNRIIVQHVVVLAHVEHIKWDIG